ERKMLTTTEAAESRGVSYPTIMKWLKHPRNPLPAVRDDSHPRGPIYLIDPDELEKYEPMPNGWPDAGPPRLKGRQPKLLSPMQAAEKKQVSYRTILTWIAREENPLPAIRHEPDAGHRTLWIKESDLDRYDPNAHLKKGKSKKQGVGSKNNPA